MSGDISAGRDRAAGDADTRLLRRLDIKEGPTGEGEGRGAHVGVVVDVETTGLDLKEDVIIELAMRRFRFDDDGRITHVDRSYAWLEDPGRPLPEDIAKLTRLTDEDLLGTCIDEKGATSILRSASIVIAHNARFDRPRVEARLGAAAGLSWACSMEEIDWRFHGFEGRQLGYLVMQSGAFHEGHCGIADVDAVIQLLRYRFDDGRTALTGLVERSRRPSWRFHARGANFGVKDLLRARGYRWDPAVQMWWREVPDEDRLAEEFWLAGHVYGGDARPRALGPEVERIEATTRFL